MKAEKYAKKSAKAIAESYLNVVKFSKAFRIFVLAVLVLMLWWIFTFSVSTVTVLIVCAVLVICNHLVLQNQIRQYNSLPLILTDLLDAEKYLEVCLELAGKIKRTSGMSALNLANAYCHNGDFDKAKTALEGAVIKGGRQSALIMDVQYDMINFGICAEQGDLVSCELLMKRMEKRIYDNRNRPKLLAILKELSAMMEGGYVLAKGDYEGYISLEPKLPAPKSRLNYVSRQYNLAKCYLSLGSSGTAETYLENTLSFEGNLYIQKQAKEMLYKLKGENQYESHRQ